MNTTVLSSTPTVIRPVQVLAEIANQMGHELPLNSIFLEKVRNREIIISAPEGALKLLKEFLQQSGIELEEVNEHFIKVPFLS